MLDLLNSLESNSNLEDKDQTKSLKSKARLFTADVEKRTEADIDYRDFRRIYHKTGNTQYTLWKILVPFEFIDSLQDW